MSELSLSEARRVKRKASTTENVVLESEGEDRVIGRVYMTCLSQSGWETC